MSTCSMRGRGRIGVNNRLSTLSKPLNPEPETQPLTH